MAVMSPEHSRGIRAALREIVRDYGPDALSRPATMSNVLKDLLPDAPRETRMLVAAAEDRVADTLREHVAQGMDPATAARLTASFFAGATMFPPDACAWVVGEFAVALGLVTEVGGPPTVVAPWSAVGVAGLPGSAGTLAPPAGPTKRPAGRAAASRRGTLAGTLYVVSEADGTLTPVDLATLVPGAAIRTPGLPRSVAISEDGSLAVVACYADGTVIPVRPGTGPGPAIRVGNGPVAVVISQDGATAYVACEADGTLVPVDLRGGTAGPPIAVGKRPYAIALDGTTAYVANQGDDTLTPVNLARAGDGAGTAIRVGAGPVAIALSGGVAYVTNHGDGTLTPVRLASYADGTAVLGAPIRVGRRPVAVAVTPDGTTAYVVNHGDDSVTPVSLPSGTTGAPVRVGRRPSAIAIAPDGTTAFVASHGDGTVTPISLPSGTPGAPVEVARRPWAIAIAR